MEFVDSPIEGDVKGNGHVVGLVGQPLLCADNLVDADVG